MSANQGGYEIIGEKRRTKFTLDLKIPPYLIAIAAGNLVEQQIGARTSVVTEPTKIAECAEEFSNLDNMVQAAEDYLGEYVWGHYTILVLPGSFPMGGMENPLLTFVSPTIVTGDKSLVDVGTHEIVHSWSGNLVTNTNQANFWLNEGFTVYGERQVTRALTTAEKSAEEATLEYAINSILGDAGAKDDIKGYLAEGKDSYASLTPILNGDHPDNAFSTIPYEKGF